MRIDWPKRTSIVETVQVSTIPIALRRNLLQNCTHASKSNHRYLEFCEKIIPILLIIQFNKEKRKNKTCHFLSLTLDSGFQIASKSRHTHNFEKFAVKIVRKNYFNILCHVIVMWYEKFCCNHKMKYVRTFNPPKKFVVSIIVNKIFMVKCVYCGQVVN